MVLWRWVAVQTQQLCHTAVKQQFGCGVDVVFELYQRSVRVCSDNLRNNIMRLKIEQFIYESVEQEMMNNYLADQ